MGIRFPSFKTVYACCFVEDTLCAGEIEFREGEESLEDVFSTSLFVRLIDFHGDEEGLKGEVREDFMVDFEGKSGERSS